MGYYSLRDYDGFTVVPEDEQYQLSQLEAEARGGNSLVNSFKMARVGNEMSLLADEESQLRTSDDPAKQEAARLLRSRIRTLRDESGVFATAPQRYEDVQKQGLSALPGYIAGQVGQAVGSSIDQMATGSAMGIASGVAGLIFHPAAQAVAWGLRGAAPLEMYRQNKNLLTGEAYNEIADDPVAMQRSAQDIRDEVSQHGYRAALLDTIPQLLPVGQISGVAGKALGRIPTSAKLLGAAVGEGLTETGQQYSQQQAHSALNPERDTSGDMSELINSGLGGFIGGGAMGGMGHVGEKMWARGRTEGDGQNGDVIDLNAPGTTSTKPEVTLNPVEQLRGKPGKFNDRESQLALVAALEGRSVEDGTTEGDMQSLETRRNLLVEHLKKIRGSQAADLLTLIESTPFESQDDKYATFDDENFKAAESLVKRKNKLTDSDLTKRNAEEPYLEGFGEIPREAVDRLPDPSEPKPSLTAGKVDSADFTFDTTPDMFADLQPEEGAPHGSINDRSAANKARYEEAQQKAKLFDTRSELVAQRLWNAYTDEHGFGVEDGERVRRGDPGAVENIRKLTSEIMAISTVDEPTPAEERRADRVARELVGLIGDRASEQLADIWRITGGSKFLRYASDEAARYARTDRAGLQAQFDDRDTAAQELVKMIPAEVEARLLKEHGIDLSSNKDRNDILDLMEDVADGRTSIPRVKLTKLFTRRVVDAMEGYLGNTIMPRLAGVREEMIDENDNSGEKTQATNTDDVHDTEVTAGDFRDIAEDSAGEVDDFEAGAAEKSHSKVAPESMVYNWAGTKKATVKDFTKAWDRNDEGRLPKLLHPGDGRMLERVQTLAGLAAEHLGDQRDRYVIGNPLAKDPIEAAGGTSAKKLMDRAGMSDDKRTQLMLEYMQQEGKTEKFDPTEANDVVKKIHFLTKIDDELTDILVNRTAIGPYGGQLSTQEKIENRGKPLDIPLDRLMPLVPPSDAAVLQKLFDSRKDVNTRVSNETLMTTVAPIVHRAKQLALDHMKTVVPGVSEFIAENPGAELKDFVNNYFSQRYAVVAEQPTDRDYLQLSPTEFKDMATRGRDALKSAYNDAGTGEAAQIVARAGRNVIHFESPHAKSGVVSIPAHALVEWVRDGRNAHTKDKNIGEESRGPQRSQHERYRDDLGEGISALVQNGLVTGLPWIVNAAGEREDFAPGETKTVPSYKVTSGPLTERQDYKTSKAQNYFVTQKGHAVKDGWKRAGVGELPPSLDLDGISVKEYNEQRGKKAYAQKMQAQADAKAKAELRAGMTPEQREQFDRNEYAEKRVAERREEARKNKELSQDPVDVQGEEAVDEAMRISEGSQTRKDEREHLQMMTSVMRAAADYLPGALTVKGAVNKAASVAGNVWKTYMADPEAGLARMAGYIRSIARGKHSGDFEGQKAFREIWNDYHALEDPAPAAQRGWGHVENKEFAKRLAADNPNVDVNHLELLEENVQDKTWNPNLIGDVDRDPKVNPRKDMALKAVQTAAQHPALVNAEANAVGGPHYALPLAAILTPRNLEAARPQDKPLMLDMRARVAATIQALWTDGKIDGGQVRKLVNHLSGYTDATLREKQDRKVPPNALAQLERRNAAKVTEGFIPNAKVREFLNGLVKGGNAAVEIQDPGTGFEGERYHTAADPVGGDKTRPLAVGGPVRGQGSTLAEREAAAREVEVEKTRKVAVPLLKNPPKAPAAHQPKETAKLLGADRVIAPVSTEGYAGDLGRAAQAEGVRFNPKHDTDMSGKVVLVSVPGKGRGFTAVDKLIEHVKLALDRGATVLTDNEANATRPHNAEGEGVLRQALIDGGYTEAYTTEHFSAWQKIENPEKHTPSSQIQAPGAPKAVSEGVGSQNTLGAAIAKHQEYLKNPPADYTTERAAAIGTWAAKQLERVRERAKTDQSDELQDMIDSLRRLVKTAGEVTTADQELEAKLGPQGDIKRNAEALTEEQAAAQFDQLSKMSAPPPKHIQVTSAIKHFERTLGDKVKLILQDSFPDMKVGGGDYNLATNVARIATANPLRILRLAYHESVHGMFNTILNAKGMEATKEMLYRAASEPKMYARLKEMLKDHPKALEDMENDMEERVAYMFQFWKLDMLTIDKKPETFFEKIQAVMRRVFGAVRDSEKALAILTAFDEGGLKEPSAAGQVIAEIMSRGEWHKKLLARFDAQSQALYTEVMAAHNVFRNSESATAQMLGKLFYTNPGYGADTERVNGVQEGMINSTRFKRNYYSNRINDALRPLDGPNMERDLKTLAEALNSHTEPTSELVRNAKNAIGKILNEFRSYAKSSGLDLGKQIGADKRYWPRVYEIEKLINGKDDFVNMLLTKHGKLMRTIASTMRDSGKYPGATEQDAADAIHQSLVDRLGVEDSRLDAERDDGVLSPYFASQNERRLDWLSDEDVAPFLSTDVTGTLTQYISQGVRAVEYTKMFGERGQTLKEMLARKGDLNFVTADGKPVFFHKDGPILRELKQAAEDQKVPEKDRTDWVERRFEDLKRASGAMEGSLGKDISAGYRKFQAGMMTYQIIRLLPLMIFSSMLDPNGIRVAGGDWDDMFNAYKRGFVGLWHNWKDMFLGNPYGSREADDLELAALAAGVINSDAINEERGNVHSSEFSSGTTRRINHAFFKAIGITQWDRDMRIMATAAARKAIVNHFNNTVPEHSARWLRELGLKRGDVYLNDKGELIVSAAELMKVKKIKNVATAQKMLEPTHFAINRWVNRAIVSPNAGLRPTRASDPHFAMFYQFKSFTYAFQETTMRYALHEAQNGNKTAALQLLRGVPIMIAADMTKAMVTGGGSLPGYMANWTLLDWVMHGINRAGLTGTGSFATDILSGNISGTLAGPSVGQAFSVAGDLLSGDVGGAITQSLPGVKQMNFMHG